MDAKPKKTRKEIEVEKWEDLYARIERVEELAVATANIAVLMHRCDAMYEDAGVAATFSMDLADAIANLEVMLRKLDAF